MKRNYFFLKKKRIDKEKMTWILKYKKKNLFCKNIITPLYFIRFRLSSIYAIKITIFNNTHRPNSLCGNPTGYTYTNTAHVTNTRPKSGAHQLLIEINTN